MATHAAVHIKRNRNVILGSLHAKKAKRDGGFLFLWAGLFGDWFWYYNSALCLRFLFQQSGFCSAKYGEQGFGI